MKTVLITGGTRGIGEAMVREFHQIGYKVIFTYLNSNDKADTITSELENAVSYRCDASSEFEVNNLVSSVLLSSDIDVVINNAGISFEGLLSDMSVNEWNKVITTNLTSVFLMCKALIPHFVSRKQGKIINISSMWGDVGASCEVAYSTSKAGINGFTKALAKELAPSGITVNAIAPGVIDTDMMSGFSDEDIKSLCEQTPLGRIGKGNDVAKAAVFLAEDSGDFITGQIINVNGGFVI